ncbi:MAG TPA: nucleotidyl transferase AbiEii/AbiGii toxin family protein [Gemmatimonadales bacterium]
MIPKTEILAVAAESKLLATTVEKDYALGWMLFGIAAHPELAQWCFKGGTSLKKCYFDTYRFSEDLDFTIPVEAAYGTESIRANLLSVAEWVNDQAGIECPPDGIAVEESTNRRGHKTFEAKATFVGPLQLRSSQRQRIRFDLTQDELVVDAPVLRQVFHGYSDAPTPLPRVRCYSLSEVLAEKVRAMFERSGRARDVYDIVNVGRNLRPDLDPDLIREITRKKFAFKALSPPTSGMLLARIDPAVLTSDWANSLRHQLPVLPPVKEFLDALAEVLAWLLERAALGPALVPVPGGKAESTVPPVRLAHSFAHRSLGVGIPASQGTVLPSAVFGNGMDQLRYAARNRLLAQISYHGVSRLVEPYSLRVPGTGNLLLYGFEVQRGIGVGGGIKAFKVAELGDVQVTDRPFHARYVVEL